MGGSTPVGIEPVPFSTSWSRVKNHKSKNLRVKLPWFRNVRLRTIKHPGGPSESGRLSVQAQLNCHLEPDAFTTPCVHLKGSSPSDPWPQINRVYSSHTNVNLFPKFGSKGGLMKRWRDAGMAGWKKKQRQIKNSKSISFYRDREKTHTTWRLTGASMSERQPDRRMTFSTIWGKKQNKMREYNNMVLLILSVLD